MSWYMSQKCKYVEGKVNAAIYDLKNKKVYSINSEGKNIIEKVLRNENVPLNKEEREYINELLKMGLLSNKPSNDIPLKVKPKLNFVWLEITEKCNMRCIHCYGKFGEPKIEPQNLMNIEDWKKVIDTIKSMGCNRIQLIGGEPMTSPQFYEILNYAHNIGIKKITVFTNATLINERSIEEFKKCNVRVRVSLYGNDDNSHEEITQLKGSFERTKKALLLLKKEKIPTSIAVTIMKENEKNIEKIKEYIESLGYEYNGYDVIRPSNITEKYEHSVTEYTTLRKRYRTKPEFYITEEEFYLRQQFNPCWINKIVITCEGNVLPCVFARDIVAGNVKKDKKEDIEKNLLKIWKITKDKIEECSECEYRYACNDCRPLAIGITGKIDTKYPRCCYEPKSGKWKEIEEISREIE